MAWWDSSMQRRSIQAGMRVQTQEGLRLGRYLHDIPTQVHPLAESATTGSAHV